MAGALAGLGVEPGDRVATMLPTGNDYLAAWHAVVWLGAIEVPVNVEYRGSFLEHILRDSGATVLVVHEKWLGRISTVELPDVRHVVVVGGGEGAHGPPATMKAHAFADFFAHDPVARHASDEHDPTYIMYTSGTTGRSKGAVHNNRSSIHYIMPFVEGLDLGDDDVCYSMFPLFHQMGRSACTTAALWAGNRVELRSGFSASGFWDDVRACGATWMGYFGAVILFLWQNPPSPRRPRASAHPRLRLERGAGADGALAGAVRRHAVGGLRIDGDRARLRSRAGLPTEARHDGPPVPAGRGGDRGRARQPAAAGPGR